MENKNEKLHRNCEMHDAEHCDINDHDNLNPEFDDCGHRVGGDGPDMHRDLNKYSSGLDMSVRPKNANKDQHPEQGPAYKK